MQTCHIHDTMILGAISLEKGDDWVRPWRLPQDRLSLFPTPADGLLSVAGITSGVRLSVITDATNLTLHSTTDFDGKRDFDLVNDAGELLKTVTLEAGEERACFTNLPQGRKALSIWLPHTHSTYLKSLEIEDGASLDAPCGSSKRWIHYGSSISMCRQAHSPARTWPGVVARKSGLNLTSLGFAGQCHIDPMVGRMIRELPADFISLKLGINVMGGSSLSMRTFCGAVIGMIMTIREQHPDIPIALISPIVCPDREHSPNSVGLTLTKIREEVEQACIRICDTVGDHQLHYFDGRILFDEHLAKSYLPDGLHPNGDGYEIMGQRFCKHILPTLSI